RPLRTSAPPQVVQLREGRLRPVRVESDDVGLNRYPREAVGGGSPEESARRIEAALEGERGAVRDVMLLNAAAALVVAGQAEDLREGVARAAEAVASGAARDRLERLRRLAGAPEAVA